MFLPVVASPSRTQLLSGGLRALDKSRPGQKKTETAAFPVNKFIPNPATPTQAGGETNRKGNRKKPVSLPLLSLSIFNQRLHSHFLSCICLFFTLEVSCLQQVMKSDFFNLRFKKTKTLSENCDMLARQRPRGPKRARCKVSTLRGGHEVKLGHP